MKNIIIFKKLKMSLNQIEDTNKVKNEEEYESLQINRTKKIQEIKNTISKYKKIIILLSFIIIIIALLIIFLLFKRKSVNLKESTFNNNKNSNTNNINNNLSAISSKDNNGNLNQKINNEINSETVNKINNKINNEINTEDNNKINNTIYNINNINNINITTTENIETKKTNNVIPDYSLYNFSFSYINGTLIKRKINVKYMDFRPPFQLERFDVHQILMEKYEVIQSNNPDYVIFGEFGNRNFGIENRFNCVKLFLTTANREPDFRNTDYAIGTHYINNGDRYFRKPTDTHQLTAIYSIYNVIEVKGIDIKSKKFCAWVVSNGSIDVRNKFYNRLSLYKTVDSGGAFLNNVGGPVDDKIKFLSGYKFSICFEKSKTKGYISEILSDSFEAGTIPIYYGDDTILELINNRSYIHIKNESEFDEKIELIKKIDQNDTLYEEIIKEKIVIDDSRYPKEIQKYKNFIYHIIEQDKEKAKRFERKK